MIAAPHRARVLVTGGTGVVGNATVAALLRRSHRVRLLTRHADVDARVWPDDVEPRVANVVDPNSVLGAAEGCDTVVHIAGAVRDRSEATMQQVNVLGTRHVVAEAVRARVQRFVFVSSLGADRGSSEYHRSKRSAEDIVCGFPGRWVILRPGLVYGPGDEVVSLLLRMMRSLPALPVVGRSRPFQPIWHEDLGAAIAAAVERDDVVGRTLELAGSETTTVDDILDRFEQLSEVAPPRVPLPAFLAKLGAPLIEHFAVGALLAGLTDLDTPIDSAKVAMLEEENVVRAAEGNALRGVFGVRPTPLQEGLSRLVKELPEQPPEKGDGPLERKRFWAVVQDGSLSAPELMRVFRDEAGTLLPMDFGSKDTPVGPLEPGTTLTLELPIRGEVQVRVEEATDDHVTLATVQGHPLAGIVRFISRPDDAGVLFLIEIFARPANLLDRLMMKSGGAAMQRSVWREAVQRVIERTGGRARDGVREESVELEGPDADEIDEWVNALVETRRREENARAVGRSPEGLPDSVTRAPPESAA